jgi:hypothetical protein
VLFNNLTNECGLTNKLVRLDDFIHDDDKNKDKYISINNTSGFNKKLNIMNISGINNEKTINFYIQFDLVELFVQN